MASSLECRFPVWREPPPKLHTQSVVDNNNINMKDLVSCYNQQHYDTCFSANYEETNRLGR